jgi:hypothetical protein
MLIDSTHFAAELAVAAQALEAAKIHLQIATAAMSDIVCGRAELLAPTATPDTQVLPAPPPTRVPRSHRRQQFARFLGTYLAPGVEHSVHEIFVAWQEQDPKAKMTSVRSWVSDMVPQGELVRRPIGKRDGLYSVPPMLRVVAEGD